jgi:hypothetical protein
MAINLRKRFLKELNNRACVEFNYKLRSRDEAEEVNRS